VRVHPISYLHGLFFFFLSSPSLWGRHCGILVRVTVLEYDTIRYCARENERNNERMKERLFYHCPEPRSPFPSWYGIGIVLECLLFFFFLSHTLDYMPYDIISIMILVAKLTLGKMKRKEEKASPTPSISVTKKCNRL